MYFLIKTLMLHFQLLDLPCIVESYKTIDNKTAYKTADISQVSNTIYVHCLKIWILFVQALKTDKNVKPRWAFLAVFTEIADKIYFYIQCISLFLIQTIHVYCVYSAKSKIQTTAKCCYTVPISYCLLYMNRVPGDCYMYSRQIKQTLILMHVPLLYRICNDFRIKQVLVYLQY